MAIPSLDLVCPVPGSWLICQLTGSIDRRIKTEVLRIVKGRIELSCSDAPGHRSPRSVLRRAAGTVRLEGPPPVPIAGRPTHPLRPIDPARPGGPAVTDRSSESAGRGGSDGGHARADSKPARPVGTNDVRLIGHGEEHASKRREFILPRRVGLVCEFLPCRRHNGATRSSARDSDLRPASRRRGVAGPLSDRVPPAFSHPGVFDDDRHRSPLRPHPDRWPVPAGLARPVRWSRRRRRRTGPADRSNRTGRPASPPPRPDLLAMTPRGRAIAPPTAGRRWPTTCSAG